MVIKYIDLYNDIQANFHQKFVFQLVFHNLSNPRITKFWYVGSNSSSGSSAFHPIIFDSHFCETGRKYMKLVALKIVFVVMSVFRMVRPTTHCTNCREYHGTF